MTETICKLCRKPKAHLICGLCQLSVCKKCSEKRDLDSFSYLDSIPIELSHKIYCGSCFSETVQPALTDYNQSMARARRVYVYYKGQGEETRFLNRNQKPIEVKGCPDREETLMRLAFQTVKANFNGLVDVSIVSTKVRNFGYQTVEWNGKGTPTQVDGKKLEQHEKNRK